ncbi:MAG: DUF4386 family protein [Candidatus Hermodarchaeota archaeon]
MEIRLCGFLFLLIIFLYLILIPALGYKVEITDSDAELHKINENLRKFQIGIGLALFHNVLVITLAIMLFIVFSPYNLILGIVWVIFRIGEGMILIYNDKNYRGLIKIAKKYADTSDIEKISLNNIARNIIKTKSSTFYVALIFWSIGTLTFSIVLVSYGTVLSLIGWLGIIGSILTGFGNGIKLLKQKKILFESIGGLVALIFEILVGGWLLFFASV